MQKINAYVRYYVNDFMKALNYLLFNEKPQDNNCYLAFNASLEEITKHLPPILQDKIIIIDYPQANVFIDKRKAPI